MTRCTPGRTSSGADHVYLDGPTACVATPEVIRNIKSQINANGILSFADSRLAARAGLLNVPYGGNTGFNDGVIYPPEEAGAGPQLAGLRQPMRKFSLTKPKGVMNCLVLLVDFSDNQGTQTPAHFQNLLFDSANPNSMRSFYKDLSYGKLDVQGQVTGWIRAQHPYSYYTNGQSGTDANSYPRNTPGLLQEALQTWAQTNSLAPFDKNGDGFIDGLFLVHAGGGAESEPNPLKRSDMIWSHKWTLPSAFKKNGVKAYAYFTAPEDGRLGVFSHEFGHFLGLPDLYDTSYRSHGIGDWCLMAGGSWNGDGDRPARLSAWCLSTLGWISPRNVILAGNLTINPLADDRTACYRLWNRGKPSKEYFLIENRQRSGRDIDLPGSGLAVWHIDETQANNTNPIAYKVALVQADGRRDLEMNRNQGEAGDLFPGSKKVTSLSSASAAHPHTRDNSGAATRVALSGISMTNGVVKVRVKV